MRRALQASAFVALVLIVVAIIGLFVLACGCVGNTAVTAARFSALRADHTKLRAFLSAMPKGADLHVHLSGSVYAEDLLRWGEAYEDGNGRGLCFEIASGKVVMPPCSDKAPALTDALTKQWLYDAIVNALSMRNFLPSAGTPSGHDQFFSTFGKFGEATWRVTAPMTATLLRRYAAESVQHTELMITLTPPEPRLTDELLARIKETDDPAARLTLLKDYIAQAVPVAKKAMRGWETSVNRLLNCDSGAADPGCGVSYRYIAQVSRNSDEARVFANTALAAALVRADARVAGLNFVGPEDYRVAREDYRKHMAAIGFLTKKTTTDSEVPVALHAGELWLGLVPPADLSFHIREAVETAGAKRIGHGVALAFERRSDELLATMRRRKVAVEINLTSNDVILGVRGKDHPLVAYRAANVPVALSTDDAGVSRIDLTNEYFRAVRDYPIGYRELKAIARTSIEHSFLRDTAKSAALTQLNYAFRKFEQDVVKNGSLFGNAWALVASLWR